MTSIQDKLHKLTPPMKHTQVKEGLMHLHDAFKASETSLNALPHHPDFNDLEKEAF